MKLQMPQECIVLAKLYELHGNGLSTRSAIENRKLKKFRHLVAYLNQKSPYYGNLIRDLDIDIEECLPTDFPVMTKTMVMENFDRIVTDSRVTKDGIKSFLDRSKDHRNPFLDTYHVVHTSGSSEEIGYFIFSRADWLRALAQGIRNEPLGRVFERRSFAFFGKTGGHYAGVSTVTTGIYNAANKKHDIRIYDINDPLNSTVEDLNAFQPKVLGGYTTALKMLAEKQSAGMLRIAPRSIEALGEVVTEADKAYLQSVFQCGVFNLYGCSEHLLMGITRPGQSAMTLYDDDLIYEFHPDHTIVTNLFNSTLPLIRYRMSDILRLHSPPTPALPYPLIENIAGRLDVTVTFKNRFGDEQVVSSYMIGAHAIPGILRYQLQPLTETSFNFAICLESGLTPAQQTDAADCAGQWLKSVLAQKMMDNVSFYIRIVDDIPVNPKTGKFDSILSSASTN
jgi:phenylacetate-coenzyme A ligase PaaK-like adenylate-forming protein